MLLTGAKFPAGVIKCILLLQKLHAVFIGFLGRNLPARADQGRRTDFSLHHNCTILVRGFLDDQKGSGDGLYLVPLHSTGFAWFQLCSSAGY